jgi:hypothetical protein
MYTDYVETLNFQEPSKMYLYPRICINDEFDILYVVYLATVMYTN